MSDLTEQEIELKIAAMMLESEKRGAAAKGMSLGEYRAWQIERSAKIEAEKEVEAALKLERRIKSYLEDFDIPARTLRALESIPMHTESLAAISKQTDILVLSGGPGCGKSVAAAFWLVFNSIDRNDAGLWGAGFWITAASLSRGYAYDQEAFSKLTKKHALVIDDLGTEYQDQKERYLATLAEIVETRFAREKLTLITTNLGPSEFKARYGERLADRIREDGSFVECGTVSLRRKQQI